MNSLKILWVAQKQEISIPYQWLTAFQRSMGLLNKNLKWNVNVVFSSVMKLCN